MLDTLAYTALLAAPEISGFMARAIDDAAKSVGRSVGDGLADSLKGHADGFFGAAANLLSDAVDRTVNSQRAVTESISDAFKKVGAIVVPAANYQRLLEVERLLRENRIDEARAMAARSAGSEVQR